MAACTGVDKVRLLHRFDHIAEHPVRRDMSVDLIDHAKFLDVKVYKRIVFDPVIHGHFQKRLQMTPVVMPGDEIRKC